MTDHKDGWIEILPYEEPVSEKGFWAEMGLIGLFMAVGYILGMITALLLL